MISAAAWILARLRARFRCALALSLAFRALNLVLLAPLAAAILAFGLRRWGRASVGNFEIAAFLLSPAGLAALLGTGAISLATLYLEISGLLRLLADDHLHWWQSFKSSTWTFHRLVHLGLRQLAAYLLLAAPFLAVIGLIYWVFWSGRDLNGLIILKPREFWWGAALAALVAAIYGLLALRMFFRWLYSVPILAFEPGVTVPRALRASVERSRGLVWRSAGVFAAWAVAQSCLAAIVLASTRWLSLAILGRDFSSLTTTVVAAAVVLAASTLMAALVNVLANVSLAVVVLSLYRQVAPEGALVQRSGESGPVRRTLVGWKLGAALLVATVSMVAVSLLGIANLKLSDHVEITAHRAGAAGAPENTIAALRKAIADRADWAEIDVQLTADKALVVMHDIDLARVGGGNRPVGEVTLAEIQALDVGSIIGPEFAGEQIPTLAELLAAAGDAIRLNVELKPHGKSDALELTRRVIDELRRAQIVDRCRLCSQSYESLQLAREIEPGLEVGYIAATAVGELTKLDINFLMVKSSLATRSLVERAQLGQIAVHAWTVNDPSLVAPLLDVGVANLITDDPALIRARLDELSAMGTIERLLLRARNQLVE
jgi:glycerophosphoryl diester phosphodiesterase